LRALVRRAQGANDVVEVGGLRLDRRARRLQVRSSDALQPPLPLDLPAREFEVLLELMSPPGRVVSKRSLSDKLSGFDDALGANALEAFISRLRRKLQGSGATIRTLRGLGYVVEAQDGDGD
jgi:DNA-binding response OmpR family regulator